MPLVVPGMQTSLGDGDQGEWLNKLVGKKLSEFTTDANTFAKKDLPESHRILRPGDSMIMDYRPERLNIHLDEQDIVKDVNFS